MTIDLTKLDEQKVSMSDIKQGFIDTETAFIDADSVLETDIENLIDYQFQDWTPTVTGGGSMTVSSVAITTAKYIKIGKLFVYAFDLNCTLSGTADAVVFVTVPESLIVSGFYSAGAGFHFDGSSKDLSAYVSGTTTLAIRKEGASAFSLGSSRFFRMFGTAPIA